MVGNDWHKAKEEWCDPDRPFDPTLASVPPKQSDVQMPQWKKEVIWGRQWQDPNDDPTQQDHYTGMSEFSLSQRDDGW